jgi:hypothetical protein
MDSFPILGSASAVPPRIFDFFAALREDFRIVEKISVMLSQS